MSILFRMALGVFRGSRYEEASTAFDQVDNTNERWWGFFDYRADELERSHRLLDALEESKKVIGLAPAFCMGYFRSARLLSQLGDHAAAFDMANLALERLGPTDTTRRTKLNDIRSQALKALEPRKFNFARLPVELQVHIILFAVGDSDAKMFSFMLVCRSWRNIIIGTPGLWRHVVLGSKTTLEMADTWLQRAEGTLSTLHIDYGFSLKPKILRNATGILWSKLEVLDILHVEPASLSLPPGVLEQLRLRTLCIGLSDSRDMWKSLCNMDGSRMSTLILRVKTSMYLNGLPFSRLTFLGVESNHSLKRTYDLIRRNHMLETLVLMNERSMEVDIPDVIDDNTDRVVLTKLSCLRVAGREAHCLLRFMRAPNLKRLKLSSDFGPSAIRSIDALLQHKLVHLEELSLTRYVIDGDGLISLTRVTPSLTTFRMTQCANHSMNSVVEALSIPVEQGEDPSSLQVCCRRLQHVDLSYTFGVEVEPVIQLVKSRLPNPSTPVDSQAEPTSPLTESVIRPLSIVSLNLEECKKFDKDTLTWLETVVPDLRC